MNRLLLFLLLPLFVVFGALIGAQSANAVSPYDNLIQTTDKLTVQYEQNSDTEYDLTTSYAGVFLASSGQLTTDKSYIWQNGLPAHYKDAWDNKQSWGVIQYKTPTQTYIRVIFSKLDTIPVNFYQITPQLPALVFNSITNTDIYYINLTMQDSSVNNRILVTTPNVPTPDWYFYTGSADYQFFYYFNWQFNYPQNYEGIIVPDSPPPPTQTIDTSPAWYISNITDNKAVFHDQNFNTFDDTPFLCEGGLAPVLHYEIFRQLNDQEILITSGVVSATAQIEYQFDKPIIDQNSPPPSDRDYLILGWYDCGDGTIFPNQGRLTFSINPSGQLVVDLFESCFLPEFPFLNIPACLNNLYTTINLLYFGQVQLPNFTFDPACRNLSTLDDWLGLPNGYQVCPQIPNFVRQITTPFIAFLLGLVTLGFIKRIRGDFDG